MKTGLVKNYLTAPTKCFIPKCKSVCCTNAPLPIDFLPKHTEKIQRGILSAANIGRNSYGDTYDSVIYNTTKNPVQMVGVAEDGGIILAIPSDLLKELKINTKAQVNELVKQYDRFQNYCPFITDSAKCSVYKDRPPICREFGTLTDRQNICPEKASRLEVVKWYIKDFCGFYKDFFKNTFSTIKNAFTKNKVAK